MEKNVRHLLFEHIQYLNLSYKFSLNEKIYDQQ